MYNICKHQILWECIQCQKRPWRATLQLYFSLASYRGGVCFYFFLIFEDCQQGRRGALKSAGLQIYGCVHFNSLCWAAGTSSRRRTACQHYFYVVVSFRPEQPMKSVFSHRDVKPRFRDLLCGVSDRLPCLCKWLLTEPYHKMQLRNQLQTTKCISNANLALCQTFFPFCFVRFIHSTVPWNNRTDS